MSMKNRIINRLLKIAKKHKVLTYPVLALVAIISAFSYFFNWTTGAGKRVVALVMVMVMLVSQSYFLTSSATTLVDDEAAMTTQNELQKQDKESADLVTTEADKVTNEKSTQAENKAEDNTNVSPSEENEANQESTAADETVKNSSETNDDAIADDKNVQAQDEDVPAMTNKTTLMAKESQTGQKNKVQYFLNYSFTNDGTNRKAPIGGADTFVESKEDISSSMKDSDYTYDLSGIVNEESWIQAAVNSLSADETGCYTFSGLYSDAHCTQPLTNFSQMHANNENVIRIYTKCTLTNFKVTIASELENNESFDYKLDGTGKADSHLVKVTDGTAQFTLTDINRYINTGSSNVSVYSVSGADVTGGQATSSGTDSLAVTLTGGAAGGVNRTVTLKWTGKEYKVIYAQKADGSAATQNKEQTLRYGDATAVSYSESDVGVEQKPGYVFKEWHIGSKDGAVLPARTTITSDYHKELFSTGESDRKVLYPAYEYAGIEMVGNDSDKLVYQYKTTSANVVLKAQYTYEAGREQDGTFQYSIPSDQQSALEALGFTFKIDAAGVTIINAGKGPSSVTSAPLPFSITVTDPNSTEQPKTFDYTVTVNKKKIFLSAPASGKTKVYDATVAVPDDLPTTISTVDVNGKPTSASVTFDRSKAEYNNPNVAAATKIILPADYKIVMSDGESPDNYELQSREITGATITKRGVFLKTTTGISTIRAGEATPVDSFGIELDNSVNQQGNFGFCGTDTIENGALGEIIYTTDRSSDLEVTGTFEIFANTTTSSNYEVKFVQGEGATFKVIQETPQLNVNYRINAVEGSNGWYTGKGNILAIAGAGYDTVLLSTDGGQNFTERSELSEEFSENSNLYIKLKNSNTNAITSAAPLGIKYDATKPEYVGYYVKELDYNNITSPILNEKPLYFPGTGGAFTFGTYVNSVLTIEIEYQSDTSGLARLDYGLFGDGIGTNSVNFNAKTNKATIQILKKSVPQIGVIRCQAYDNAGNASNPIELKPVQSDKNSYEWGVESAGPAIDSFTIYSGKNGNVIVSDQSGKSDKDMEYYNNCEAQLSVTDDASGIYSVTWHINGTDVEELAGDQKSKVTSKMFKKKIAADGTDTSYTVSATVRDDAGNEVDTGSFTFKLDDVEPNLVVDYDKHVWTRDQKVTFHTSDDLSGVYYARVTDADGNTIDCDLGSPKDGEYTASFQAVKKGTYTIEVSDKAGNIASWTENINMISNEVPECPVVSFVPDQPDGENGWYVSKPTAVLQTVLKTTDETPVSSAYTIWKDGETSYNNTTITKETENVSMKDDGLFHIKVWSKSASGVECANYDDHITDVKIDTQAPKISFTTEKGSGSSILVKFTIKDSVSGVDKNSIKIKHGTQNMTAEVEETEDGYTGSFEITSTGNYSIQAADVAGNVADEAAFTPMSMKIKAITNITNSGATVGAMIYKGTFDITSANISYRKIADDTYKETDAVMVKDNNGNAAISSILQDLTPATCYAYKVSAVSQAGEVLEYEGYFQTLADNPQDGITIVGTARYQDDQTGTITVGLYAGNNCIMAKEIPSGEEFVFNHVQDGNYNLVATDGTYSKSIRVSVEDGMIVYPTQYIELVLSGKNTSVYLTTPDTPNISADNMDSIFDDDIINFTDQDRDLIVAGGTIEFQLCATLMTVSNVSAGEISAMYAVTDKNKIVGAYLDLTLYKIVTDVNGNMQKKKVTDLANGANVSVTIPLGELAGKPGLEVIRIHNDGENFIGSSLVDQDNNANTYTITTNQFSTYAVLYSVGSNSTTQPTTQPDTQYVDNSTTRSDNTQTDGSVTTQENKTTQNTEAKKNIDDKGKKPKTNNTSSIGSLRSSGSAKTGDEAPIAMVILLMLTSVGGVLFIRKKQTK